jgi:hypothetical protein
VIVPGDPLPIPESDGGRNIEQGVASLLARNDLLLDSPFHDYGPAKCILEQEMDRSPAVEGVIGQVNIEDGNSRDDNNDCGWGW